MPHKRPFLILYSILIFLVILAQWIKTPVLAYIAKPLLMVSLATFFYFNVKDTFNTFAKLILVALLLSCIGDTFLLFQSDPHNYFVPGLASFLLAHIVYSYAFLRYPLSGNLKQHLGIFTTKPHLILPFIAYLLLFMYVLHNDLGTLLVPVAIYAIVINFMALAALSRWHRVSDYSFSMVFWGALIFVLSDSIIAINKFLTSIPFDNIFIMSTYCLAQYMIVKGAYEQLKPTSVR